MVVISILNADNKLLYDISDLVYDIEVFFTLESQPGKMTFNIKKDEGNILKICNGSKVSFAHDGNRIFYGRIFNIKKNKQGDMKIVAYDNLKYLQNHGFFQIEPFTGGNTGKVDYTLSKILTLAEVEFKIESFVQSLLRSHTFVDVSYFEMIDYVLNSAFANIVDTQFKSGVLLLSETSEEFQSFLKTWVNKMCVYCDYSVIKIRKIADMDSKLIIGENSLMTDYEFETSAENLINTIIITKNDTSQNAKDESGKNVKGKKIEGFLNDTESVKKYGTLNKVVNVKDESTEEEIKKYMRVFLLTNNVESNKLTIKALGVDGLRAGSVIRLDVPKLGFNNIPVYISSCTHRYSGNKHTMDLEISTEGVL